MADIGNLPAPGQKPWSLNPAITAINAESTALNTLVTSGRLSPDGVTSTVNTSVNSAAVSRNAQGPAIGLQPGTLLKWRAKMGELRAGTSDARVLFMGDSTTQGVGATVPVSDSFPAVIARQVNSTGISAGLGLIIPPSQISNDPTRDPRWVPGTGWTLDSKGFGSAAVFQSSGTAGDLILNIPTEVGTTDRYDIYYVGSGSSPAFTATVTGRTSAATVTPGTVNGIGKFTLTGTEVAGAQVTITPGAGNTVRIVGIEGYNSARKRLLISNAGVPATSSVGWLLGSTNYGSVPAIKAYAPHLSVISLGLNDAPGGTTKAAFKANIAALIDAARISGDVILLPFPPRSVDASESLRVAYLDAYRELAAEKNVALVDINSRWVSYTATSGLGYWFDLLHPTTKGYADIAQALLPVIVEAPGKSSTDTRQLSTGFIYNFDPLFATTSTNTGSTDRLNFYRAFGSGTISKIGLEILVSAGNIVVAVYRNSGSGFNGTPSRLVGTSGVVACPAAGYAEVALTSAVDLQPGDWLAFGQTDSTATFRGAYNSAIVSNFFKGRAAYQGSAIPAPTIPTPINGLNRAICLLGIA